MIRPAMTLELVVVEQGATAVVCGTCTLYASAAEVNGRASVTAAQPTIAAIHCCGGSEIYVRSHAAAFSAFKEQVVEAGEHH